MVTGTKQIKTGVKGGLKVGHLHDSV